MTVRAAIAIGISALLTATAASAQTQNHSDYDVLIHGGTIYDGSGANPYVGDVAIKADKIVYVGPHARGIPARVVDATGEAVSPGFVNMLSWATESLIADGRGLSDVDQASPSKSSAKANRWGRSRRR